MEDYIAVKEENRKKDTTKTSRAQQAPKTVH